MSKLQSDGYGTLAKYVALQIPGMVLVGAGLAAAVWIFEFSATLALGLGALWIVKDALMYPIVRVAYAPSDPDASRHLIGALGTAQARVDPEGYVKIGAELWRARLVRDAGPIEGGASVRVVEVRGLTLHVEAD